MKKMTKVVLFVFLLGFVLVWLLPMIGALVTSVRTMDDIMTNGFWAVPKTITLDNFVEAWTRGNLVKYLVNSFAITLPALAGTLLLSSMCAYALAAYKFKGNSLVFVTFVGGMLIPFQVLLIPVFKLSNGIGIYDSYWALIMIHLVFQLGFCTFFLRNFMKTVPQSLGEAARIDGCSEFSIYWKVYLPLAKPAMAAVGTLEFTWIFNDYLWALVLLRNNELKPVTAGLASLRGTYISQWNVMVAGALIATIPTILVFIFLQRYFIEGLTMGSGK